MVGDTGPYVRVADRTAVPLPTRSSTSRLVYPLVSFETAIFVRLDNFSRTYTTLGLRFWLI